jgi:GNAT acetyltransferase-like protein
MALSDLEFLRRHIEAVWDVRVPPLAPGDNDLPPGPAAPPWSLHLSHQANGAVVRCWGWAVPQEARSALLARAEEALARPASETVGPGITREVILRREAAPHLSPAEAARRARPFTVHDAAALRASRIAARLEPATAPQCGVFVDGEVVALAHSSRRTAFACELGVETVPHARRSGYALAATVLWTEAVLAEGLLPIYSAHLENGASLALAHATGFRELARAAYIPGESE